MTTLSSIIAAVTALIFGAAGLWLGGKSRGRSEQKAESDITQAQASAQAEKQVATTRVESIKVANDVKDEVARTTDADVRDRVRKNWTR